MSDTTLHDRLRAHIEELEAENAAQRECIAKLEDRIVALREAGDALRRDAKHARDRIYSLAGADEPISKAIIAWDTATASAGETPMKMSDREVKISKAGCFAFEAWRRNESDAELDQRLRELGNALEYASLDRDDRAPTPTDTVIAKGEDWEVRTMKLGSTVNVFQAPEPAPTPTEAEGDPALQARPDRERIDDLITRADGASDRLDMHMRQISDLQKQMGNLTRRGDIHYDRISLLEKESSAPEAALEAARTPEPEPVVTDAMVLAYWEAITDMRGVKHVAVGRQSGNDAEIRRGLAAALKAGGAR